MILSSAEHGASLRRWAERRGVPLCEAETGWEVTLPGERRAAISLRGERLAVTVPLPDGVRSWSAGELLRWHYARPLGVAADSATGVRQLRAALPTEGLVDLHVDLLLDALLFEAEGEPSASGPGAPDPRGLSTVRRWWEREHGGLGIREREGTLGLRCRLPARGMPVELRARPVRSGIWLEAEVLAGPFVEPECAGALHRCLLILNAWIAPGGFALAPDGSPVAGVLLPAPVSSAHVGHGIRAVLAAHQRFAAPLRQLATSVTARDAWHRFNADERGGD